MRPAGDAGTVGRASGLVVSGMGMMRGVARELDVWAGQRGWRRVAPHPWRLFVQQFWRKAQVTGPVVAGLHDGWHAAIVPAWDRDVTESLRHHVVVAVGLPRPVSPLRIRPRTGRTATAGLPASGVEIRFPDPALDERYRAQSPDPGGARQLLTPAVVTLLVQGPLLSIEITGQWIGAYVQARFAPDLVDGLVATATGLAASVAAGQDESGPSSTANGCRPQ